MLNIIGILGLVHAAIASPWVMEGVDHPSVIRRALGKSSSGKPSDEPWKNYTQTVEQYDQLLDHFDPTANTTF